MQSTDKESQSINELISLIEAGLFHECGFYRNSIQVILNRLQQLPASIEIQKIKSSLEDIMKLSSITPEDLSALKQTTTNALKLSQNTDDHSISVLDVLVAKLSKQFAINGQKQLDLYLTESTLNGETDSNASVKRPVIEVNNNTSDLTLSNSIENEIEFSDNPKLSWKCDNCTFINDIKHRKCDVCGTRIVESVRKRLIADSCDKPRKKTKSLETNTEQSSANEKRDNGLTSGDSLSALSPAAERFKYNHQQAMSSKTTGERKKTQLQLNEYDHESIDESIENGMSSVRRNSSKRKSSITTAIHKKETMKNVVTSDHSSKSVFTPSKESGSGAQVSSSASSSPRSLLSVGGGGGGNSNAKCAAEDIVWQCATCTLENSLSERRCLACGGIRTSIFKNLRTNGNSGEIEENNEINPSPEDNITSSNRNSGSSASRQEKHKSMMRELSMLRSSSVDSIEHEYRTNTGYLYVNERAAASKARSAISHTIKSLAGNLSLRNIVGTNNTDSCSPYRSDSVGHNSAQNFGFRDSLFSEISIKPKIKKPHKPRPSATSAYPIRSPNIGSDYQVDLSTLPTPVSHPSLLYTHCVDQSRDCDQKPLSNQIVEEKINSSDTQQSDIMVSDTPDRQCLDVNATIIETKEPNGLLILENESKEVEKSEENYFEAVTTHAELDTIRDPYDDLSRNTCSSSSVVPQESCFYPHNFSYGENHSDNQNYPPNHHKYDDEVFKHRRAVHDTKYWEVLWIPPPVVTNNASKALIYTTTDSSSNTGSNRNSGSSSVVVNHSFPSSANTEENTRCVVEEVINHSIGSIEKHEFNQEQQSRVETKAAAPCGCSSATQAMSEALNDLDASDDIGTIEKREEYDAIQHTEYSSSLNKEMQSSLQPSSLKLSLQTPSASQPSNSTEKIMIPTIKATIDDKRQQMVFNQDSLESLDNFLLKFAGCQIKALKVLWECGYDFIVAEEEMKLLIHQHTTEYQKNLQQHTTNDNSTSGIPTSMHHDNSVIPPECENKSESNNIMEEDEQQTNTSPKENESLLNQTHSVNESNNSNGNDEVRSDKQGVFLSCSTSSTAADTSIIKTEDSSIQINEEIQNIKPSSSVPLSLPIEKSTNLTKITASSVKNAVEIMNENEKSSETSGNTNNENQQEIRSENEIENQKECDTVSSPQKEINNEVEAAALTSLSNSSSLLLVPQEEEEEEEESSVLLCNQNEIMSELERQLFSHPLPTTARENTPLPLYDLDYTVFEDEAKRLSFVAAATQFWDDFKSLKGALHDQFTYIELQDFFYCVWGKMRSEELMDTEHEYKLMTRRVAAAERRRIKQEKQLNRKKRKSNTENDTIDHSTSSTNNATEKHNQTSAFNDENDEIQQNQDNTQQEKSLSSPKSALSSTSSANEKQRPNERTSSQSSKNTTTSPVLISSVKMQQNGNNVKYNRPDDVDRQQNAEENDEKMELENETEQKEGNENENEEDEEEEDEEEDEEDNEEDEEEDEEDDEEEEEDESKENTSLDHDSDVISTTHNDNTSKISSKTITYNNKSAQKTNNGEYKIARKTIRNFEMKEVSVTANGSEHSTSKNNNGNKLSKNNTSNTQQKTLISNKPTMQWSKDPLRSQQNSKIMTDKVTERAYTGIDSYINDSYKSIPSTKRVPSNTGDVVGASNTTTGAQNNSRIPPSLHSSSPALWQRTAKHNAIPNNHIDMAANPYSKMNQTVRSLDRDSNRRSLSPVHSSNMQSSSQSTASTNATSTKIKNNSKTTAKLSSERIPGSMDVSETKQVLYPPDGYSTTNANSLPSDPYLSRDHRKLMSQSTDYEYYYPSNYYEGNLSYPSSSYSSSYSTSTRYPLWQTGDQPSSYRGTSATTAAQWEEYNARSGRYSSNIGGISSSNSISGSKPVPPSISQLSVYPDDKIKYNQSVPISIVSTAAYSGRGYYTSSVHQNMYNSSSYDRYDYEKEQNIPVHSSVSSGGVAGHGRNASYYYDYGYDYDISDKRSYGNPTHAGNYPAVPSGSSHTTSSGAYMSYKRPYDHHSSAPYDASSHHIPHSISSHAYPPPTRELNPHHSNYYPSTQTSHHMPALLNNSNNNNNNNSSSNSNIGYSTNRSRSPTPAHSYLSKQKHTNNSNTDNATSDRSGNKKHPKKS